MIIRTSEGPQSPRTATMAPGTPRTRAPNTTARFATFGPGRNWQSAKTSLNSAGLIQRRSSTAIRRAQARVPPNPKIETMAKLENRLQNVGRGAGAGAGDSAIPDDYRRDSGKTIDRMAECQIACYRRAVFPWPNLFDRSDRR